MIIQTIQYRYSCNECGYTWTSDVALSNPQCPKCYTYEWSSPEANQIRRIVRDFKSYEFDPCGHCLNKPKPGDMRACHCTVPYMRGFGGTC